MAEVTTMWPRDLDGLFLNGVVAAAVIVSMGLLGTIAISSSDLAVGVRLGRLALGAHTAWIATFLYFYCEGWGRLAIRFPEPGGGYNRHPLVLAGPALALLFLYFVIPISVSRFSSGLSGGAAPVLARVLRFLSPACWVGALLGFVVGVHQRWTGSQLMGFAIMALGAFVAAGTGAALGDRFSRNLLLAEAVAVWLVVVIGRFLVSRAG